MTTFDRSAQPPRRPQLARRVVTTLLAWVAAYVVVNGVVLVGGSALATASPALQTLVISGTLVTLMINLLMPLIARVVARFFAAGTGAPDA